LQKAKGDFREQKSDEARLTLDVKNMQLQVVKLKRRGVEFTVEQIRKSYGIMSVFHDSEGNGIESVQREINTE